MNRVAYSYSCLMAKLPESLAEKVRALASTIPDEAILNDEAGEKGRPHDSHITVKYGIHTTDIEEVQSLLASQPPLKATLGRTTVFWNDSIVLKISVQSQDLARLNKLISKNLDCTDTHPDYKPHITVAYLKKDEKYPYYFQDHFTDEFSGIEIELDTLVFSTPEGTKTMIKLSGKVASIARELRIATRLVAGTRSLIGVMQPDNSIKAVYCHSESYRNLDTLKDYYHSRGAVSHLVDGGDIEFLDENPEDLKRLGGSPKHYRSYNEFRESRTDYMFLFIRGHWFDVTDHLPGFASAWEKQD